MFGKYNGFVSKARVSACMYFLVRLMNNELMSTLNMDGHSDKIAFRPTALFQIITG
jgi:hypothetical protein